MADAYTEFLNLTKPEVGASRDSWGDKWNTNAGKLDAWAKGIDAAVKANTALANAAMPKVGGTFSGDLAIQKASPAISWIYPNVERWVAKVEANADLTFYQGADVGGSVAMTLKNDGTLITKKIGNVADAIAAAAKAGNDALAKAVAKTGDTMTGDLTLQKAGYAGARMIVPSQTDILVRAIGGGRFQICDGAATYEMFSVGSDGTMSTRQLGDINTWAERRMQDHQNAAANRCVTQVRWVMAGQKGYNDQPGTGGFISPFGGHAMNCDYWSWRFAAADGQVGSAPFAGRWRALQVYIANNGDWVTIGAAS